MAAVPSVVVGFLAALWLAPRLEAALLTVVLAAAGLPIAVVLCLGAWRLIPAGLRRRLPDGGELVVLAAAVAVVAAAATVLAGPIETRFFGGDLQRCLFTEWGLGRAVGETMIVLMAAGNTPVLDLSLFNGMRTMSAAIAVEIPEAPVGDTLFRVLFLTGILLFAFTLVLTTAADLVGSYLRKRYARF
jgi:ABC-type uncharacterized transport system permease subunit